MSDTLFHVNQISWNSEKAEKLTILVKKIVKLQEETGHFSPIKSWLNQQGFLYCLPYWFQFLMLNGIQMITWKGSILLSNLIKVWIFTRLEETSNQKLDFSFLKVRDSVLRIGIFLVIQWLRHHMWDSQQMNRVNKELFGTQWSVSPSMTSL